MQVVAWKYASAREAPIDNRGHINAIEIFLVLPIFCRYA